MENKMIIPWVNGHNIYDSAHIATLKHRNISDDVKLIEDTGEAISELESVKYPLIITGLKMAPGPEHYHGSDKSIEAYLKDGRYYSMVKCYCEIGLEFIRKVKSEQSANKDTPLIVFDFLTDLSCVFDKKETLIQACKEAGASTLLDKIETLPDKFSQVVREHLGL